MSRRLVAVVVALTTALLLAPAAPLAAVDTITAPDAGTGSNGHISMVLDAAGNPVISHVDSTGNLRVVHCNDAACAGNNESRVTADPAAGPFTSTSIALAGGNPVVSYRGGTGGTLKVLRCNDANCAAGGDSIVSIEVAGAGSTSLAIDAQGFPVVSFWTPDGNLRLLHCNDALCAGSNDSLTTPYQGHSATAQQALLLSAAGRPLVSLHEVLDGSIKLLSCDDPDCAGETDPVEEPQTGNVGAYNSLRLDGQGRPVVAYQAPSGLRVMHCTDALCSALPSFSTPHARPGVTHTSLALDAGGNPVVSYLAGGAASGLHVLHCDDAACAGDDDAPQLVDALAVAGATALALDAAGRPVVAYLTAAGVSLLHCDDALCASSGTGTGSISGTITAGAAIAGAFVQACGGEVPCPHAQTDALGHYNIGSLPAGTYTVAVSAPGNLFAAPRNVVLVAGVQKVENFALTAPVLPQPDTTVAAVRTVLGTPVVREGAAFHVTKTRCANGSGLASLTQSGVVRASGQMTAAGPGLLQIDLTAPGFIGAASLRLTITCPVATDEKDDTFDLYVEPAAFVRDLAGAPLAGATVTLNSAEAEAGPFAPVAGGSVVMGPLNRSNPSTTAADGSFGWETMTGYYFVRATLAGCSAPGHPETPQVDSPVFAAPPFPLGLELRLACGVADSDGDGYSDNDELTLGKDPLTPCAVMRADVDGDKSVTVFDIGAVAGYFGRSVPDAPARYLQGGDNTIDIFDLGAVAGNFGKSVLTCP